MHIIGNMWFLWIFGNNVEDSMGHVRFVLFYLLCGFAAAGLQIFSNPVSGIPMVGASGAIGGVMGAYVLLYPRVNVHMLFWLGFYMTTFAIPAICAIWMMGYWFLVQLIGGLGSLGAQGGGVAFWADVGGFVAGAVLVLVFRDRKPLGVFIARGRCGGCPSAREGGAAVPLPRPAGRCRPARSHPAGAGALHLKDPVPGWHHACHL